MHNVELAIGLLVFCLLYLAPAAAVVNFMIQDRRIAGRDELRWSGSVLAVIPVFHWYLLIPYLLEYREQSYKPAGTTQR